MPDFKELFNKLKEAFQKLTLVQKLILGGILAGLVVALIVMANFSAKPTYSLLYKSPLTPEEYARITKKLNEWNVKFDTKDDKYILLKDENQSRTIRMRLGQEGIIPSTVKGWELFDTQKFTTTDFERNVNLQRAIIGEMIKHLKTLEDIEDVNIEVAFPKERLYSEYQGETTASVVIVPAPHSDISENKSKIKGIVKLVAMGIPNLKEENIVVVDNKGNVLSDLLTPDEAGENVKLAKEHLKIKAKETAALIAKIKEALKQSIDPKRLLITADIEFDWTKKKVEQDKIIPIVVKEDNPLTPYDESEVIVNAPISEKKTKEDFK